MNWESIVEINAWSRLSDLNVPCDAIGPAVCRVADHAYLVTEWCGRVDPDGTRVGADYVTGALWAESDVAARFRELRYESYDWEAAAAFSNGRAEGNALASKPPAMLLFGTGGTYEELKRLIPYSGYRTPMWYDGETVIAIRRLKYYFVGRPEPVTRPYAIRVTLFTEDCRHHAYYKRNASLNIGDFRSDVEAQS